MKKLLLTIVIYQSLSFSSMKKTILWVFSAIIAMMAITACSNDGEVEGKKVEPNQTDGFVLGIQLDSVSNQIGSVRFNHDNGLWYIEEAKEPSVGLVRGYYLETLDKALQTEGLRILFSGVVFQLESPIIKSPEKTRSLGIILTNALCLSEGEKSQMTVQAEQQLTGRWKLVYEGIQQGKVADYKTYAQFWSDGTAAYEKNVGEDNETITKDIWGTINDWAADNARECMTGHIYSTLFGYNGYYSCMLRNDSLYFTPDYGDSRAFLVDPGLGFVRVK